ncbi:MAG: FG-GAP-like repeat-containing protein [Nannocystaceae bacterium]|nr:FG-GAP-like repeat-containing protein [Nannocystaceae bacterium]
MTRVRPHSRRSTSRRLDRHVWALSALALTSLPAARAHALDPFTNGSAMLNNPSLSSGVAIGAWDMNEDGLDDIVRLGDTNSLEIEYQQADGSFVLYDYGYVQGDSWSLSIGDADNNGFADIFTGGAYDDLKLLLASDDGSDFQIGFLGGPQIFLQCSNFADIDNDGWLDIFACHDDGISSPYRNDGTAQFTRDLTLINPASTVPSDNSGNYGTVWTDYDNDGDVDMYLAKCRLGVNNPDDGRRLNLLFQNDGSGNYTDVAEAAGVRPHDQSWSSDFGDVDNDGDLDMFLVAHAVGSRLYENQGPGAGLGTFVDVTADSGMVADLAAIDLGINTHFEDFDNDTLIDLIVTGREGEHRLFMNNGDLTFTAADEPFPSDGHGIQSAVVGDFDNDGFPDVMAGFATGFNQPSGVADRLFINPGNDNNFVNVWLTGVVSNRSAAGARVEVTGAWGTQIREVRTGEAYGITNAGTRHFGLGTADAIDSIVIRWPSGMVDTIEDPPINQTIHVVEGCPGTWYRDADGDGYGDASMTTGGCIPPAGYVADDTDCDDAQETVFPGNDEYCDALDNDCDTEIDEELVDCHPGTSSGGAESGGSSDGGVDSSGGGSGSASAGTGLTSADGTAGGDDSSSGGAGQDDDTGGGCGCTTSPRGGAWALLLLALPAVRRRRAGARA